MVLRTKKDQESSRIWVFQRFSIAPVFFILVMWSLQLVASSDVDRGEQRLPEGEAWLERMTTAMQTQSYRGVFVYSRGNISSSMKVIHRYKGGVDREKFIQLDGDMGEILRTGDEVTCVLPDNRVISLEQSIPSGPFPGAFARTLMPKKEHYLITVEGEDRVAGHPAIKIGVMAKDGYRYNYVLWLEKSSGLLLKSTLLGVKGEVLERFQYTSLELAENITDAELDPNNMGEAYSHERLPSIQTSSEWPANTEWRIDWLPSGFLPVNRGLSAKGNIGSGNVQVFTDGLASFSVFIENTGKGSMPEGASLIGATVAYAHRLRWKDHEYMVTVVGEVPIAAAMKVAEKVVPDIN